jgi:hypothetical protein
MKHRCKHRSENRHETVTDGLADLRRNRRNERDQAGLDWLARWQFSQAGCATHYTTSSLPFAMNGPVKISARKLCDFRTG